MARAGGGRGGSVYLPALFAVSELNESTSLMKKTANVKRNIIARKYRGDRYNRAISENDSDRARDIGSRY